MKVFTNHLITYCCITFLFFLFSQKSAAQSTVVLPGSFQSELGCPGDWMPDCNATRLTPTGPGKWEGSFLIPAGSWEYKVAYDNSWAENYGAGGLLGGPNIPLVLNSPTLVHFTYSSITHLVSLSFGTTVILAGSFQSERGCPGDWMPDCPATALTYDITSNTWYGIFAFPPGNYEYKVTLNNSWAENYGAGGVPNGPNIPLNVSGDKKILFRYNPVTHIVTTAVIDYSVTLAGSFQSESGCIADWQADCPQTGLVFDAINNLWTGNLILPAGNWEFKTTIDGSWAVNYGAGGVPNGSNMVLNLPEVSRVSFTYNPQSHVTSYTVKSTTVVIAGSFQSELGCTSSFGGDWEPTCNLTRLTYDGVNRVWTGTFTIPAGNWEYKVTHDNSWAENYGLYGVPGGLNIPLNLILPASITFNYDPVSHLVTLVYNTTGICVTSFYDANANGYKDYEDTIMMEGVQFTLTGKSSTVQNTGSDGKTCFSGLTPGGYSIEEELLNGYLPTTRDSQSVYLTEPQALNFGSVCIGGAGARDIGFWMNKQGQALFASLPEWQSDYIMQVLRYLSLRNTDGSDFDPKNYTELRAWLQRANAKNMVYALSAQMAVLYLNAEINMLGYRSIYTPGINYWGDQRDFMNVFTVVLYVNQQLLFDSLSFGGNSNRPVYENLRNMLAQANSDQSFAQLQPCGGTAVIAARKEPVIDVSNENGSVAAIWPNPTGSHFNLRPAHMPVYGTIRIRVVDMLGRQVYLATGNSDKDYRFGENFKPGLYMVEVTSGSKRSTSKIVKQ